MKQIKRCHVWTRSRVAKCLFWRSLALSWQSNNFGNRNSPRFFFLLTGGRSCGKRPQNTPVSLIQSSSFAFKFVSGKLPSLTIDDATDICLLYSFVDTGLSNVGQAFVRIQGGKILQYTEPVFTDLIPHEIAALRLVYTLLNLGNILRTPI